jgi:hypothetical protein
MLLPLTLLLAGCLGSPPDVTSLSPGVVMPGDPLRIDGAAFDEEVEGELVQGDVTVPLPVDVVSETQATTVVPPELASGTWTLRMITPSGKHGQERPLEVWRVETEPACDKRFALKVETSRTHREVAVERIFTDRPATRDVYGKDQLAGLERTATPTRSGATCQAVWLRLQDGGLVLLVDDTARDLGPVAGELAKTLGVPLQ